MKAKVTVHFGRIRVVVPCHEDMTVANLIDASVLRYRKAIGKSSEYHIRVHRFQCMRDCGILDPDDRLFDVFDEDNDQILAIYDEQDDCASDRNMRFAVGGTSSPSTSSPIAFSASEIRNDVSTNAFSSSSDGDIVEVTSLTEPPTNGLRVLVNGTHPMEQQASSSSSSVQNVPALRSVHYEQRRSAVSSTGRLQPLFIKNERSPKLKHKTVAASDVERRFVKNTSGGGGQRSLPSGDGPGSMSRSSARKSRITDSFFEAKERLEESLAVQVDHVRTPSSSKEKLIPLMPAANPLQTVIVLSDSLVNQTLGIEIAPVSDPSNTSRLQSVEVRQIDEEGRIAADGRIKMGDHIVEINHRPVYQMSISRARAYLHELQSVAHPTLTVDRPVDSFQNPEISAKDDADNQASSSTLMKRPVLSALQQANTTAIGATSSVEIMKSGHGFGFTVTSRDTAKGERLFYIGTVKPNGPAFGILRAGDRLLEVNDEQTIGMRQCDVVDGLKQARVGDKVRLLISRIEKEAEAPNESHSTLPGTKEAAEQRNSEDEKVVVTQKKAPERSHQEDVEREEILSLDIPLNDTGSAGLGVSLKARAIMKPDGSRHDCGIFIKKVLHGGAAYKDGRLKVNDQLVGIEDVDLRALKKNAEASDAITKCLKTIGPSAPSVHLLIARILSTVSKEPGTSNGPSTPTTNTPNSPQAITHIEIPRLRVEGYGEYATVIKTRTSDDEKLSMDGRRRASSIDDSASNICSDRVSFSGDQFALSEDEISHVDMDAFNRENPTRRSMSEKRHMGSSNDPSHTAIFQKIKHSRQASAPAPQEKFACGNVVQVGSAPPLRSVSSLQEKGRPRTNSRLRAVTLSSGTVGGVFSVLNKDFADSKRKNTPEASIHPVRPDGPYEVVLLRKTTEISSSPKRRSMSLENMGARKAAAQSALHDMNSVSKKTMPTALKKAHRSKASNHLLQMTEVDPNDAENVADENATMMRQTSTSSKEKQQRRKSMGSSLFSKISQKLGGSRSRDSSPEKPSSSDVADAKTSLRKKEEDERKRIQDQYDRLKQKQQKENFLSSQSSSSFAGPDQMLSYATFEPNKVEEDVSSESGEKLSDEQDVLPEFHVANSKFYGSILRSKPAKRPTALHCRDLSTTEVRTTEAEAATMEPIMPRIPTTTGTPTEIISTPSVGNSDNQITTNTAASSTTDSPSTTADSVRIIARPSMRGLSVVQQPTPKFPHLATPVDTLECTRDMECRRLVTTPVPYQKEPQCRRKESTTKDSTRVQASTPQRLTPNDQQMVSPPAFRHLPVAFPTSRTVFILPSASSSNRHQSSMRASAKNRPKSSATPGSSSKVAPAVNTFEASSKPLKHRPLPPPIPLPPSFPAPPPPPAACHTRSHSLSQFPVSQATKGTGMRSRPDGYQDHIPKKSNEPLVIDEFPTSPSALQRMLNSPFRNTITSVSRPSVRNIKVHKVQGTREPLPLSPANRNASSPVLSSQGRQSPLTVHKPQSPLETRFGDLTSNVWVPSADFDYRRLLRPVRVRAQEQGQQRYTVISAMPPELENTQWGSLKLRSARS